MPDKNYNLYWGEIHTHTFCYGPQAYASIEEAAQIAASHLDFWAPGEHYNYLGGKKHHPLFDWKRIAQVVKNSYQPGKFVTFPGFEFIGDDGDYNIYFDRDISSLPEVLTYTDLFAYADKMKAIVIPHHIGYKAGSRGMRWDWFDPTIMPLVEVFSMHGSSERDPGPYPMDLPWMGPRESGGCALAGLKKGHIFGFIASSDAHNAYPGSYKMGLVAAYAADLTRESLWEAFLARRTYAVTGDRIGLEFRLDGQPMGTLIKKREGALAVTADGLDAIDKIEIVKNGEVIVNESTSLKRDYPGGSKGRFKVRIEWGWGPDEPWSAEGELFVKKGKILSAVPCFASPGPNKILKVEENKVSWQSTTPGRGAMDWKIGRYQREGTNSIVFAIEGDGNTVLELKINERKFSYSLGDLWEASRVELMGEWNGQKVKFHSPVNEAQYRRSVKFTDKEKENSDRDFYYARITQANGQMAWSSPIWVM